MRFIFVGALIILFFGGCKPSDSSIDTEPLDVQVLEVIDSVLQWSDSPIFTSGEKTFDPDKFADNIENALDGKVTGYAYSINFKKQFYKGGAGGWAIAPPLAGPSIAQDFKKRAMPASVNKTITAVAVLRASEEKGISINNHFVNYLPESWEVHPSLNGVTIRQLLKHKSGITNGGNSYNGVKNLAEAGVDISKIDQYDYNNANYSMLRIVFAYMLLPEIMGIVDQFADSDLMAMVTAKILEVYIRENLFEPIGIENAQLFSTDPHPTHFHDCNDDSKGYTTGDLSLKIGPFGWYLSTFDLNNFLAHLRYDNDFLSASRRKLMFEQRLGLFATNGDHGKYLRHGGYWFSGSRGMRSGIIIFPIQVEASLIINCKTGKSATNILKKAFDEAWE